MRVRQAIKKVVALGTSSVMLGATLLGATALDLSDYPSPFVKDGKFNAMIVVGDSAAASDVVGAVDIAAQLQYDMRQVVSDPGSSTTKVEGATKIETSSSQLHYGDKLTNSVPHDSGNNAGIKSAITDADLPVLFKDGTFVDKNGTSYDYELSVLPGAQSVGFGKTVPETDEPILYLDSSNTNLNYTIEITFPSAANVPGAGGKTIELFGKEFTFSDSSGEMGNEGDTAKVTLYTAAVDQTFSAGEAASVQVGGNDVTIEVVGVNTQASTAEATIKVNGESASVTQGLTTTIGGERVYVKDIFAYTQPVGGGGVRLFLGSDKLVLEDGQSVTAGTGEDSIDGTKVSISRGSGGKLSKIQVAVTPYSMFPQWKVVQEGEELVDPVFGAFKWSFTGPNLPLDDSSKAYVKVLPSAEDRVRMEFTSFGGLEYGMDMFKAFTNTSSVASINLSSGDYKVHTANNHIYDDEYFVLGTGEYQHVLRLQSLRNASSTKEIRVKDMAAGGTTQTWSHDSETGTMTYDGNTYSFTVLYTTDGEAPTHMNVTTAGAVTNKIYLEGGSYLSLPKKGVESENMWNGTAGELVIDVQEYTSKSAGSPDDYGNWTLNLTYSSGRTGNDLYITGDPGYQSDTGGSGSSFHLVGNSGYDYEAVSSYGTFLRSNRDTSASTWAEMWIPGEQAYYGVWLAPTEAQQVTTAASSSVTIEKIQVGAAKLASEISDVSAQNLIVVGGPCANAVASSLMGNPANCVAGFEEGKAVVKLYTHSNGNMAMLVAGLTARDTRRASKAVAAGDLADLPAGTMEASVTTVNEVPEVMVVSS